MRNALLLFVAMAIALPAVAQTRTPRSAPANLNFEEGAPGEAPPGWLPPPAGFMARTVETAGSKAALLSPIAGAADKARFGNLMQSIDATPYRGKWVRVRASIKVGGGSAETLAHLWFRVDRTGGRMGFFDNMSDRPVAAREWTPVEITGDVADDATALNFGLLLLGDGEALIDDVSIVPLGKVETRTEPPRPLDARGLANLTAFARLLGYVRHFHASDQAAAANWDLLAVEGVRTIEGATTPADLATKLQTFFAPLAPTVQVYAGAPAASPAGPPAASVLYWRHHGFGQKGSEAYHSERVRKEASSKEVPAPLDVDLGGGVSAHIPLAVFADASGTLPKVDAPPPPPPLLKLTGDDRATRLADVILLWNVLQHFYPYFDVAKTDWPAMLPKALRSAATDAGETAFLRTLRMMMAELQDGHGSVFHPSEASGWSLPLLFRWVDDQLVVARVADESIGLQPGDVVERIDGKPAKQLFAETEALVAAATPQYRRWVTLGRLRGGGKDSEVRLDVRTAGAEPRPVVLRRTVAMNAVEEVRPPKVGELEDGIFYVDLTRASDADVDAALPRLAAARGVIFDLRGYPRLGTGFLSHLINAPIQSARWNVPIITRPDHPRPAEYDTGGRWNIKPQGPRIHGKIVFLTDGRAISYAESIMGIIEAYKIGEIVGETTAGTNGNINPLVLPGGYRVVWTGMLVLKHDGSQHHGVGIRPTVSVLPTLRAITEKRDEQLETAVRIAKSSS